jgi:hypothetical protein
MKMIINFVVGWIREEAAKVYCKVVDITDKYHRNLSYNRQLQLGFCLGVYQTEV